MNQRVKRAIAAAMSLTMVATATPVSPLYNAIQNAVSSVMLQASAAGNEYNEHIVNYDNDTFSIDSFYDLKMFAAAVNDGYTFENKTITLADDFDMGTIDYVGLPNALKAPIGTSGHRFMGTFDGNNKTIRLDFNPAEGRAAKGYAGLFSRVSDATIRNITVTGYEFCQNNGDGCYAGGICGYAMRSNIYNCTNNAAVTAAYGDRGLAGGICGSAGFNLNVYNCTNNATVKASGDFRGYAGGICGDAASGLNVYNCIDTGRNGICGYTSPLQESDIDNCYVLTESNAEKFKGTQKVGKKTITEHLNTYVDEFNSTPSNNITLLKWEQGQDYPILKQETYAVGASLSLDGQIGVNISFYVNKDESSTITINGETVDLAQLTSVNGVYTYTLWVAPKDAYNDITFKTVKGSDTIVERLCEKISVNSKTVIKNDMW